MTAILAEPAAVVLTAEEYDALPPHPKVELVDGVAHIMTPATARHQAVVDRLVLDLKRLCPPELKVIREQEVRIGTLNRRIPDVVVVRREAYDPNGYSYHPADVVLAVEVVSPRTQTVDSLHKPMEYARAGIGHFWRIDIRPDITVSVHELVADRTYKPIGDFSVGETVTSPGLAWADLVVPSIEEID